MDMPILLDHNATSVIGKATFTDGRLLVEFRPESKITIDQVLNAFGSCRALESAVVDGAQVVLKAEVYHFSCPSAYGAPRVVAQGGGGVGGYSGGGGPKL
jgi:hypothetical protein